MAPPLITAAGISLPPKFARQNPASVPETHSYVAACMDFLTSPMVSSLLECHPNDIAIDGPRPEWDTWWGWAAADDAKWKLLIPGWTRNLSSDAIPDVPDELEQMLKTTDQLTLPRTLNPDFNTSSPDGSVPRRGMSPKKSHEVSQMSAFIESVLTQSRSDIKHIVDVGAGQGYLSRALSEYPLSMNVLALDFSEIQTKGAERRAGNIVKKLAKAAIKKSADSGISDLPNGSGASGHPSPLSTGSLTHEMTHITPQTLHVAVSRWILGQSASYPTPVMLVALHACGTLTPDILRCFLANRRTTHSFQSHPHCWYAAGLVVVGCCYNLMSPSSDFPLSALVKRENKNKLHLSYNHRSLAAQSPLQWTFNASTQAAAELAIRKVVYRALFGKLACPPRSIIPTVSFYGVEERPVKIGRLRDSAYISLQNFVSEANKKTGAEVPIPVGDERENRELTSCLEVLHALRSRIGPVVESLILVDRYLFLAEKAHDSDVFAFNLFQQELGSGRNMALAVLPRKTSL